MGNAVVGIVKKRSTDGSQGTDPEKIEVDKVQLKGHRQREILHSDVSAPDVSSFRIDHIVVLACCNKSRADEEAKSFIILHDRHPKRSSLQGISRIIARVAVHSLVEGDRHRKSGMDS